MNMFNLLIRIILIATIAQIFPKKILAQNDFLNKLTLDISYNFIDGKRISPEIYSTVDNDGEAFGVSLRYNFKKNWFAGATYQRGQVFSIDLQQEYSINNLIFSFGRGFRLFKLGMLSVKIHYASLDEPGYWSLVVFPSGSNPIAQHNYSGNIRWPHFGAGAEYRHEVGKGIYLGGSFDFFDAFYSDYATSMYSLFLRFRLKNEP